MRGLGLHALSRADICMNSKAEFHQPSIVRVSSNLGNTNEEKQGYILKVMAGGPGAGRAGAGQAGAGRVGG